MSAYVWPSVHLRACLHEYACKKAREQVCERACLHEFFRELVREQVCEREYATECASMRKRVCMHPCARAVTCAYAWVCICMWMCVHACTYARLCIRVSVHKLARKSAWGCVHLCAKVPAGMNKRECDCICAWVRCMFYLWSCITPKPALLNIEVESIVLYKWRINCFHSYKCAISYLQ